MLNMEMWNVKNVTPERIDEQTPLRAAILAIPADARNQSNIGQGQTWQIV